MKRNICSLIVVVVLMLSLVNLACAEIFVASWDNSSIRIFNNFDDGDVTPIGVIEGDQTGLDSPGGVYVTGGEIFVGNYGNNTITVYNETDRGDVAPKRTITGVSNPQNITVSGGEIFVVNNSGDAIYVFQTTDSGAASPTRTITGDQTKMSNPNGIVVSGGEIFVAQTVRAGDEDVSVLVFNVTDNGNVAPKRAIGGDQAGFTFAFGIDVAGGEIFVFDQNSMRVFSISDDGNVAPNRIIEGTNTNLTGGDNDDSFVINGEIFLTNYSNSAVYVFNLNDNGNVAPKRAIQGGNTGMNSPYDTFVTADTSSANFSVPTMSATGIILLAILLGTVVIYRIRKTGSAC